MPSSRFGAIAIRVAVVLVAGAGAGAIAGALTSPPAGGQPAPAPATSGTSTTSRTTTTAGTPTAGTTAHPAFDQQHLDLNGTGHFSAQGSACAGFAPTGNYPVSLQTSDSKATLTIQGNVPANGIIDSAGMVSLSNQFYDAQLQMWSNLSGWTGLVTYLEGAQHCPYNVTFPATGGTPESTSTSSPSTTTATTVAPATTAAPSTEVHATSAASTTGQDAALGGGLALAGAGGAAAVGLARREDERSDDRTSDGGHGPGCFDTLLFGFGGPSPPMTPMNEPLNAPDVPPEDVIPIQGDSAPPPDDIM